MNRPIRPLRSKKDMAALRQLAADNASDRIASYRRVTKAIELIERHYQGRIVGSQKGTIGGWHDLHVAQTELRRYVGTLSDRERRALLYLVWEIEPSETSAFDLTWRSNIMVVGNIRYEPAFWKWATSKEKA